MACFNYVPSRFIRELPVPRQYDYQQAQFWDYVMKEFEWRKRANDPLLSRPLWLQTNVRV